MMRQAMGVDMTIDANVIGLVAQLAVRVQMLEAQVAELRAGLWYFNVSSSAAAGGEIRGQIDNSLFRDGFD